MAGPALVKPLTCELRSGENAADVDIEDAVGHVVGLVEKWSDRHDPRVVDQDIERPEGGFGLVEEVGEPVRVGDVERIGDDTVAELGCGRLRCVGCDIADRDTCAGVDECDRDLAADAASATGYRNRESCERMR